MQSYIYPKMLGYVVFVTDHNLIIVKSQHLGLLLCILESGIRILLLSKSEATMMNYLCM